LNEYNYQLSAAEPGIQRLVNRIAKMAGLHYKIRVFSSDAPSACATFFETDPEKRRRPAIRYNPIFIEQLETVSPWAIVAMFAHEVAGHYNSNIIGKRLADAYDHGTKKEDLYRSIQADRFAGWVLWHEGARLKDAITLYNLPRFNDAVTEENPRKKTMRAGWIKAFNKKVNPSRRSKQEPPAGSNGAGDTDTNRDTSEQND
jgi:hypothetical protein